MAGHTHNNLASKYLAAIGSPEILSTTPLNEKVTDTNQEDDQTEEDEEMLTSAHSQNPVLQAPITKNTIKPPTDQGRISPVKRLIMRKEQDTIKNNATKFVPVPDEKLTPVHFGGFQRNALHVTKKRVSKPQLPNQMTASPSTKNLNKLKVIENRLGSRKSSAVRQRSVSGIQYKLKMTREKSKKNVKPIVEEQRDVSSNGDPTVEFICRLIEVKRWIEEVLGEKLTLTEDEMSDFQDYFRNGILLAEVVKKLDSSSIKKIYYGQSGSKNKYTNKRGLYFKFTENILQFLKFLKKISMPDMFVFETRDLFEMKDYPKVIFCIQALGYLMNMLGSNFKLAHLSSTDISTNAKEIRDVKSQIRGVKMPNFHNIYDGIRVNVGDDIEPISLVSESVSEKPVPVQEPAITTEPSIPEVIEKDEAIAKEEINTPKSETDNSIDTDSDDDQQHQLMSDEAKSVKSNSSMSTISESDDYMLPLEDPKMKVKDTLEARTLFKETNTALDVDMDAIEKKYNALIDKDEGLDDDADGDADYNVTIQTMGSNSDDDSLVVTDGTFPMANLISLQSLARGALLRYGLFVDKFMLKVFTPDLSRFNAIIRRILFQKRIDYEKNVRMLEEQKAQQEIHTKKLKQQQRLEAARKKFVQYESDIVFIQSFVRGGVLRNSIYHLRKDLLHQSIRVISIQASIRGILYRACPSKPTKPKIKVLRRTISPIPDSKKAKSSIHVSKSKRRPPSQHGTIVLHAQQRAERRIKRRAENLHRCRMYLTGFSSCARGFLVRRRIKLFRLYLLACSPEVTTLQSVFRGVLSRFYFDVNHELLKRESSSIIDLQARCRGGLLRYRLLARFEWFHRKENVAKIIRIQEFVRTCIAAHDYKSLINERNPPLKAVKNYIDLLSGSDASFEDEISIEKYKKKISDESQRIEKWEQDLKQLGIKLQLLKKNKVSLEQLVKFKNDNLHLTEYSENLKDLLKRSLSSNPREMLGKSSKCLLEFYGKIFYLLQTQPSYLSELLLSMDYRSLNDIIVNKHVEDWILKMFNYSYNTPATPTAPTREEFLLMKLILSASFNSFCEMGTQKEFHKFLKGRDTLHYDAMQHWEILLSSFVNLPQQRQLARNLLSNAVLRVTSDTSAWYESDPTKIYKSLLEHDEQAGKITLKDLDQEDPIDDPDTRKQFVKNLSELREAAYDIMKMIKQMIGGLPMYMRCVCRELYYQLKDQFPGESEKYYLSMVGSVLFKCYVLPAFTNPENYSIHVAGVSDDLEKVEIVTSNLEQVAKLLNQLVCMRPFNSNEVYLQPLNPFIGEFAEGVKSTVKALINVKPIDECYHMSSIYDDVASHEKPTLKIESNDILILMHYLRSNIDYIAPERNDYLRYILVGAKELTQSHQKLKTTNGVLELTLYPVTDTPDTKDLETKTLLMETKRYVIYILQVQDGEDLLDLLLSEITPTDELKFKEIVKQEKMQIREISGLDAVFEKQALDDIYNSTYPQVKKHAIELVLELENKGIVTRSDGYQRLLNDIARDIKNKRIQKESRDRRLKVVVDTLTKLTQKEKTCSKMYNEYIKDIDNAMLKLQNKSANKKKSLFSKLFSKQYYYQLSLKRKNGYVPRFGSFRYSGKNLKERGVLELISSPHGQAEIKPGRINFMFGSERQGEFLVDISQNSAGVFGQEKFTLDNLLSMQYEGKKTFNAFSNCVRFNTDRFVAFIFHKFYEVKNE